MTEYEKLHSGMIFDPGDPAILELQFRCLEKQYDFNLTRPSEMEKRMALMQEMFAEIGEDCYIEPPLHAN